MCVFVFVLGVFFEYGGEWICILVVEVLMSEGVRLVIVIDDNLIIVCNFGVI